MVTLFRVNSPLSLHAPPAQRCHLSMQASPHMQSSQPQFRPTVIRSFSLAIAAALVMIVPFVTAPGRVSAQEHATQGEHTKQHKVLMIAGARSHGYGAHEHYAGLKMLEESVLEASDNVTVEVVRGWPKDASKIDSADAIVVYSDGGKRHVAMDHRDEIREVLQRGGGLVALHYAVEMLPGESGEEWTDLLGGHFEVDYSVNPHWVAEFQSLPDHPVASNVKPFHAEDEWYFHMRFSDKGKVTPLLQAVAPEETMRRADGPHSGNPSVRKSVAAGELQTVAWAFEPETGGRAVGFTGGHYHWNWAQEPMRRLVTNAIRWAAGDKVEPNAEPLPSVTTEDLLENQDYPKPDSFDMDKIKSKFELSVAS